MTPRRTRSVQSVAGNRPATLVDVALRAGVAPSTVSRILAGIQVPRPENAEAVRRAVRELGYRPDLVARSMRTRSTAAIGVVIDNLIDPVFPGMVRAIAETAEAAGFAVVLGTALGGPVAARREVESLLARRVDGLIIACSWPSDAVGAQAAHLDVPVVLTNTEGPGVGLPQYGADNRGGARLAAAHLLALGHRRIAYIRGPSSAPFDAERLRGIREAVEAAGLDPDAIPLVQGDGTSARGMRAALELASTGAPVTAIACYNDLTAIGVLRALQVEGLRVPDDMSVVGFDDIDEATWVQPALTTVHAETEAFGRLAAEHVVRLIRGVADEADRHPAPRRLPTTLVVRESTAPPGA